MTGYEKRFYEGQLPSLIREIKRLADAMERNNELVQQAIMDAQKPADEKSEKIK